MSRTVRHRWVLSGELIAESAVHVGGVGEGPATSLGAARDGQDRPLLPGTSLAGAIRAALGPLDPAETNLWGWVSEGRNRDGDDGTGEASWVWVSDATAPADTVPAVRENVSIDRTHGVAARGHLFTREVLPIGTRFSFRLRVDDPEPGRHDGPQSAAERLVRRIAELLRGPSFTVGAATTRGLGRVRLREAALRRFCLHDSAGMIATLRGDGTEVTLDDPDADALPARVLRVTVPWRPNGPVMVQFAVDGDTVDAFPLTASTANAVHLLLPGSSIKGTLRAHAERIVRTARGGDTPQDFLEQMKTEGLAPVGRLFGTAGEAQSTRAGGRRGALTARECLGTAELPATLWADVRLLQRRLGDPEPTNGGSESARKRAALKRLHAAVAELNRKAPGVEFTITPHNAVDRWTGGAADSLLFAALEPHAHDPAAWRSIVLEIDTGWLGEKFRSALALLLFLLRDLCDGLIPFGHGTTRGMGAVRVDPAAVTFEAGAAVPLRDEVQGRSLSELLRDRELTALLDHAWATAGDPTEGPPDGVEEGEQADEACAATEPAGKSTTRPAPAATRAGKSPTVRVPSPAPAIVPRPATSTAQDALRAFAANRSADLSMVGFAYSSVAAPWFRMTAEGTPQDFSGAALDLTGVFELRAFDRQRELRWWHTGNGLGEASELTDDSMALVDARPSRSYDRLLWGKVTAVERGWATLSEPRIGSVRIPVSGPAPAGGHAWLNAVEYVAEDEHGNLAVIDERLTGVEVKGPAQ